MKETSGLNGARMLLPLGWESLFYFSPPLKKGTWTDVSFDPGSLEFVFQEMVATGAVGLATSPYFRLDIDPAEAFHLKERVQRLDPRKVLEKRVRAVFNPIAEELGFAPIDSRILLNPLTGVLQAATLHKEKPRQQMLFADFLVAYNCTYHLAAGIKERLQIDIPLRAFERAVRNLRGALKGSEGLTNMAFLASIVKSYTFRPIGGLDPTLSRASPEQVRSFLEFMEDEEYRQYAECKYALGISERTGWAVSRLWQIARRLAARKSLKPILSYAGKLAFTSAGLPAPPNESMAGLIHPGYMPPVVSTRSTMSRARKRWFATKPDDSRLISFSYASVPQLGARLSESEVKGVHTQDAEWLLDQYSFDSARPMSRSDKIRALTRFFTINLSPAYECPRHLTETGADDVRLEWGRKYLRSKVNTCCEEAARKTWVLMFAPDKRKDYSGVLEA